MDKTNNERNKDDIEVEVKGEKANPLKRLFSTISYFGFAIVLSLFITTFLMQGTQVIGKSMETTLSNNNRLILDKISYHLHDPQRFDIIVFPYLHAKDTRYIKRIIGLPGETVQIDEQGTIYIDGKALKENYGREIIKNAGNAKEPIQLGSDEYFVLGDNRNNSEDSRYSDVGLIKRKNILGKACFRIYPLWDFGFLD